MSDQIEPQKVNIAESGRSRLYLGQTAINFFGRRLIGVVVSSLLLVVTIISLAVQGLNLGIDFEGNVMGCPQVRSRLPMPMRCLLKLTSIPRIESSCAILKRFFRQGAGATISDASPRRSSAVSRRSGNVGQSATGNVNVVNELGSDITNKAIRALVIFLIVVGFYFVPLRMANGGCGDSRSGS